jgi:hypothetical protein
VVGASGICAPRFDETTFYGQIGVIRVPFYVHSHWPNEMGSQGLPDTGIEFSSVTVTRIGWIFR